MKSWTFAKIVGPHENMERFLYFENEKFCKCNKKRKKKNQLNRILTTFAKIIKFLIIVND